MTKTELKKMTIGELLSIRKALNSVIREKEKTKERIVFATMRHHIPDWQPPNNWTSLTAAERLKRLEQIQKDNTI